MELNFLKVKKIGFKIGLLFFFLLIGTASNAQIFDKVLKKVRNVTGKRMPFEKTKAISTSIQDTLYGIDWFDEDMFIPEMAEPIGSSTLGPGYYRSTVRSYCLKAGVYGPTKGDGYQIAKLKGRKAKVIHSILKKSVIYPDIPQYHVQTLIWGIEVGTKFSSYPLEFQNTVRPLLTKKEMLSMEVNFDKIKYKLLPEKVKSLMNTYASLRTKMQSAQIKYDEIEAIAVKKGVAPLGAGSKEIKKGLWSYIGNGFFMRAFPKVYSTTEVELYRPAKLDIIKDDKGRIKTILDRGKSIEIVYDDSMGSDTFDYGNTKVPIWKIKKIHLQGNQKDQDTVIEINHWIFRGSQQQLDLVMQKHQNSIEINQFEKTKRGGPFPEEINFARFDPDKKKPTWEEIYERLKKDKEVFDKYKKWYDKLKEYKGYAEEIDEFGRVRPDEYYLNEEFRKKRIQDAIKVVSNPGDAKGRSKWIRETLKMTMDLVANAICALGGCGDNRPLDPDMESYPGQPGNTAKQRIGLSQYKKEP
ncbi:hypothetical protein [Aquimarina algiphila]|uniref:hypothetical protein n=1 Tax=Aquimarina algiphila TaxID=2047982 RepID=UPI00232AAFA6|nr:hypothetical protein [Aquimarina algiphila]